MPEKMQIDIDDFEFKDLAFGISANLEEPHNTLIDIEIIQGGREEYVTVGFMVSPKTLRIIAEKFMKAADVAEEKLQEYWEDGF